MSPARMLELLSSHLLVIVGFAIASLFMAQVLTQRRPTGSTLAWLLAIALIPYVGVPLYLVFGGRKLRRRAASKHKLYPSAVPIDPTMSDTTRVLCAAGAPRPTSGNTAEVLPNGETVFAALLASIAAAQRSIHISTLILAGDEVGNAIVDALEKKARQGVQVRLLIDALFKFRSSGKRLAALRRAGGRVAFFMPVWAVFRGNANLRLHRKIVVIDDAVAIVGGMNLAREYMGPAPSQERWRDLATRLSGPAVADIAAIFHADWQFAAGQRLGPSPQERALEAAQSTPDQVGAQPGAVVQIVASGPDVESDLIYDAFLCGMFEAKKRLWIATPYFVPDEALARGVLLALRRGVDVRIVVPARSNHFTADLAGASHLREIAKAGGHIHCYAPGMMHGKVFIIDDSMGVLGSANVDMRSLFLNYEIALLFTTSAEIEAAQHWFVSLLPDCVELRPSGRARQLFEALARLLAPLE